MTVVCERCTRATPPSLEKDRLLVGVVNQETLAVTLVLQRSARETMYETASHVATFSVRFTRLTRHCSTGPIMVTVVCVAQTKGKP